MRFSISDRFYVPDSELRDESTNTPPIVLYPKRYLMNFLLSLSLLLNGIYWISFSAITTNLTTYFGKKENAINWFSNVFLVFPGLCSIVSIFLPNIIGLRNCLILGCLIHVLGTVLRFIGIYVSSITQNQKFIICMFGSSILAISQGIILNLPSFLSAKWFGVKERDISTAFAFLSNLIGVSLGYLIPFSIMLKYNTPSRYETGLKIIVSIEFGLTLIVTLITFIWAQDRPPTPPSISETMALNIKSNLSTRTIIINSMKQTFLLFKNPKMVLILTIYGFYYTNSNLISTFLCEMMDYYNKQPNRLVGYIGASSTLMGAFGTLIFGVIVGKIGSNSNPKVSSLINLLCCVLACVILIINESGLNTNYSIGPLYVIFGFHSDAFLSLGFELMANISYPYEPNISANAGLLVSNVLGSVVLTIFGSLEQGQKHRYSYIFAITTYLINSIVLITVKFKNKRQHAEENAL